MALIGGSIGVGGGTSSGGLELWSRAYLHALMTDLAGRPLDDETLTPAIKDSLLTIAQATWYRKLSAVVPEANYGPPIPLVTRDGGRTYVFGVDEALHPAGVMGHVELVRGNQHRPVDVPGSVMGRGGFLVEGNAIRWTDGGARTFSDGLFARAVTQPGIIDADHEPTLMPKDARLLIVFEALALWAKRVRRDPAEFRELARDAFYGNPREGDHGILGSLRTQYHLSGAAAIPEEESVRWWDGIDTGAGYVRHD